MLQAKMSQHCSVAAPAQSRTIRSSRFGHGQLGSADSDPDNWVLTQNEYGVLMSLKNKTMRV